MQLPEPPPRLWPSLSSKVPVPIRSPRTWCFGSQPGGRMDVVEAALGLSSSDLGLHGPSHHATCLNLISNPGE